MLAQNPSEFPLQPGVLRMNALKLLKKDHADVKSLFTKFERTSATDYNKRSAYFVQIRRELQVHSRAEEEIFYPAIKALNGEGRRLISQAIKEHREIDDLLTQISRLRLTDENFEDKFEALIENFEHHVAEEEGEIFQFAEENCSEHQLDDIGRQISERKRILDQQLAA